MTERKSRRVVIINNINSETIDQAIFILKSDRGDIMLSGGKNTDIVREAQKIIDNYIRQVELFKTDKGANKKTARKKRKRAKSILGLMTVLCCLAICFTVATYLMK